MVILLSEVTPTRWRVPGQMQVMMMTMQSRAVFGAVLLAVASHWVWPCRAAADQTSTQIQAQSPNDETVAVGSIDRSAASDPHAPPADDPVLVGWLELSGTMPDAPMPYAWVIGGRDSRPSLRGVVRQLDRVARSERHAGVVLYLDEAELDLAQIDEICTSIQAIRDRGKKVLVFAQQYDLLTYSLACAADQILLQHKGAVELAGLHIEEIYLAGLLDKLGVKADMLQVGQFKGAMEPLTRTGPSPAWNQNIDPVLDDVYDHILGRIMRGRGIDGHTVEDLVARCWSMTDQDFVANGLVDCLVNRDLVEVTGQVFGDCFEWDDLLEGPAPKQRMDNPFVLLKMLFREPTVQVIRPSLAVIQAQGPITMGESRIDGSFGGPSIGSRTLVDALEEAVQNDLIKGVVLRVDSPGGSALASELIWQAIRELVQVKPVFVSIRSVAASGGYYIACAGNEIYASPGSLVGSIGVVGGKIVLGELYEKIGLNVHRRSRGPLGDMFNSVEPFTPDQRAAVEAAFDRTYEQFTNRVVTGRSQRLEDIDAVAQGRIFTGRLAASNGLVDHIGGIDAALTDLAQRVGLETGSYDILNLPPPRSLSEILEELFGFQAVRGPMGMERNGVWGWPQSPLIQAARHALGERAWRSVRQVMGGLVLLRSEPVLAVMPAAIVIR